jgi:DNA-binding PadR family transcriptional regulator
MNPTPDPIDSFIPLSEATFFILLSIGEVKKHGYAIIKDVQHLSRGRVSLSTGTLYGALSRLLEQGLIERVEDSGGLAPGKPRKVYILSRLGRGVLAAEINRIDSLAMAAQQRLKGAWQ